MLRSPNFDRKPGRPVPIHPDVEFTFDEGGKLVPKEADIGSIPNRVNALIEYYGPPNFGFMDTEGYGPGMGPYGQPAGLAMGPEMSPVSRRRAEDLIPRATPGLFWNACLRLFLVPGNLRLALQSDLKSDFALE
jgi:hypothetical protein